MKTMACPKCGKSIEVHEGVTEASHRCPSDRQKTVLFVEVSR